MDKTQVLLIVLIAICYTGFGINYLKEMIRKQYKDDKSEIPFYVKLILFAFWWIELIEMFIWKADRI